jgi:hypothetical protein
MYINVHTYTYMHKKYTSICNFIKIYMNIGIRKELEMENEKLNEKNLNAKIKQDEKLKSRLLEKRRLKLKNILPTKGSMRNLDIST